MDNEPLLPQSLPGKFPSFVTPLPWTSDEWQQGKAALRAKLARLLGDLPPMFHAEAKVESRRQCSGYVLERITFDNGAGATVYGYLLVPEKAGGPHPAVLYHHFHGGRYNNGKEEVVTRAFESLDFSPGEELARAGYVVLAIDAYGFGERQNQGPAGGREDGRASEESLAKMFLWQGRTLWGMMVRDDLLALDYLTRRSEVDARRIAAMGMSMGSTRSWWAAAMDERIAAVVSVACLTRYQNLLARGELAQHGIYYFVPGMLQQRIDMESVMGLIAPRPHLTLTGDSDAGSPLDGVHAINGFLSSLYQLYGREESFRAVVYERTGHVFTPAMWREAINWLRVHLGLPD